MIHIILTILIHDNSDIHRRIYCGGGGGEGSTNPQMSAPTPSGVTLPFGAPLLIFCRPHKFFSLQKKKKKKKKKKVATFFSVFLIGFFPPAAFCTPKYFFSRRPNAKLADIWYILLLCHKIFRLKNCKFANMPPP